MITSLQPHVITIENYPPVEPSGDVARVSETLILSGEIDGLPLMKQYRHAVTVLTANGEVKPFPIEDSEVFYIVSLMVAQALPTRRDLLVPVGQMRDATGKITGCKGLARI